jgi:hypothetical protein
MRTAQRLPLFLKASPMVFLLALTGCATLIHGAEQRIPIASDPPGARVVIDDVHVGNTPLEVILRRSRVHLVTISLDSATTNHVVLNRGCSKWLLGNAFLYGAPVLVDLATGAAYELSPAAVWTAFAPIESTAAVSHTPAPAAPAGATRPSGDLPAGNAVFLELLGNGVLGSVNYERALGPRVTARVGVSNLSAFETGREPDAGAFATGPVMMTYLAGSGNRRLEAGVGALLGLGDLNDSEAIEVATLRARSVKGIPTMTLGYRHQRPGAGSVFRAGVTPLYSRRDGLQPWLGVSYGYAF